MNGYWWWCCWAMIGRWRRLMKCICTRQQRQTSFFATSTHLAPARKHRHHCECASPVSPDTCGLSARPVCLQLYLIDCDRLRRSERAASNMRPSAL